MYVRVSCMKRHLKVECGQLPKYQCQICKGWFKYRHNLSAHMELHYSEPKFACPACPKKFYRRDKLVDHEKKAHGGLKPESVWEIIKSEFSVQLGVLTYQDCYWRWLKNSPLYKNPIRELSYYRIYKQSNLEFSITKDEYRRT